MVTTVERILPYIESKISKIEHEATTSKIAEDQVFYCNQRGIPTEKQLL
jgi:Fe-S cluster assembly protein SufB